MRNLLEPRRLRMVWLWAVVFGLPLILDACARNTHIHV